MSAPALATTPVVTETNGPDDVPHYVAGNLTCADLGLGNTETKFDNQGSLFDGNTKDGITIYVSPDGNVPRKSVSFISTRLINAVLVKGGPGENAYVYEPDQLSDDGLTAPENKDISHVSFCYDTTTTPPPFVPNGALTVEKTAAGTYDRLHEWDITKSVTPATQSGLAGDSFTAHYTITADKTTTDSNFKVAGKITVGNTSTNTDVQVVVSDSLPGAVVDCDDATAGAQGTVAVVKGGSVECTYAIAATDASATSNTATATATATMPTGHTAHFGAVSDTATIGYTATVTGDNSVTLADPMFNISQLISSDTTLNPVGGYTCPTNERAYTNRKLTKTVTNTATITGSTIESASATTTYNCTYPWVNETATGKGTDWTKNSNWFMFTPVSALANGAKVDLIAGQHYDAGDIALSGNQLTITIADDFRFDPDALNNVKVHALGSCAADQKYVMPGSYSIKTTATGTSVTLTVSTTNICAYAIHVDVERRVS